MDYDSCLIDGFDFNEVSQLVNLPYDHVISMIVVGKASQQGRERLTQLPISDGIINDKF